MMTKSRGCWVLFHFIAASAETLAVLRELIQEARTGLVRVEKC